MRLVCSTLLHVLLLTDSVNGQHVDGGGKYIVQGAGASFPKLVYEDAMFAYESVNKDALVSYKSTGSSGGKLRIMTETAQGFAYQTAEDGGDLADTKGFPWDIDYAGSDSILSDDYYSTDAPSDDYGTDITMTGSPDAQMYPTVAGAVCPIYNLPEVSSLDGDEVLVLSKELTVKIFAGLITTWNDAELMDIQSPTVAAALATITEPIQVFVREDGSGTTEIFKKALNEFTSDPNLWFDAFEAANQTVSSGASKDYNKKKDAIWAHGVSFCDGNTGVASCTANTPYSIGYSVLGDALDANLDIAVMGDSYEKYVVASAQSVQFAVSELGLDFGNNGDDPYRLTANIHNAEGSLAWPIAGYTYLVMRKNYLRHGANTPADSSNLAEGQTGAANCDNRAETVKYWEWFYYSDTVTQLALARGFAPLPAGVRDYVFERLSHDIYCPRDGVSNTEWMEYPLNKANDAAVTTGGTIVYAFPESYPVTMYGVGPMEQAFSLFTKAYSAIDAELAPTYSFAESDSAQACYTANDGSLGMLTYSNVDATLLEASFSVPFAGVAFAVIFNPCGGAVEADCQGYSDRASVDEALGTVSMTAAQMAKVFSGEITSWAALGAELGNDNMAGLSGDIALYGRATNEEMMVEFKETLVALGAPDFTYASSLTSLDSDSDVRSRIYSTANTIAVTPYYGKLSDLASVVSYEGVAPGADAVALCADEATYDSTLRTFDLKSSVSEGCYPLATSFNIVIPSSADYDESADETGCQATKVKYTEMISWLTTSSSNGRVLKGMQIAALSMAAITGYGTNADGDLVGDVVTDLNGIKCGGVSVLNPPIEHDFNYINDGLKLTAAVISIFTLVLCLLSFVSVGLWRKVRIIKMAQPEMLFLVISGCTISIVSIFYMSMEDNGMEPSEGDANIYYPDEGYGRWEELDAACNIQLYLYSIGDGLTFATLFAKMFRVWRIFNPAKSMTKVKMRVKDVLPIVAFFVLIRVFVLALWQSGEDALIWRREVLLKDSLGNVIESVGKCYSPDPWMYLTPIIIFQVMCYGCGNYICYACRNMPSQFQESKYISFSMVNSIQTFVIAVPMIVMMSDNPQIAFLFKILFLNMQTLGNLTLSIGPPVFKILMGDESAVKVTASNGATSDTTGTVGTGAGSNETVGAGPMTTNNAVPTVS